MEQTIYLARHAHAEDGSPDETRPLSSKGFKQMGRLVKGLRKNGFIQVDETWHSGLTRSTETARCLIDGLDLPETFIQTDGLAPYDNPKAIMKAIDATEKNILIVGHEPNLSALGSLLLSGEIDSTNFVFNKASILALSRLRAGEKSSKWDVQFHIWHRLFKS